jgi:hypothetical protein
MVMQITLYTLAQPQFEMLPLRTLLPPMLSVQSLAKPRWQDPFAITFWKMITVFGGANN